MKKAVVLLSFIIAFSFMPSCGDDYVAPEEAPDTVAVFFDSLTADYPLDVKNAVSMFGMNADFGFRTSGSEAELAAGEYLYNEMIDIGLQNVFMDEITVDAWEFTGATLAITDDDGDSREIVMTSYQTQFECEAEEFALVYAGQGTDADYADIDVKGKLILIDIDQSENQRINWPAYQAKIKGAAAVIAAGTDGYGQYYNEIHSASDIRGPADAPVFSLTARDSDALKKLIEASETGEITARLTADSRVIDDTTAYSIIGEIPGDSDEVIYMTAHYDGYFNSDEENAIGPGTALGIAKALVDSGYAPHKTIRFILHPAGEWGISDSRYDRDTGAYMTVNKHPEWAEKAFALIDIGDGLTNGQAVGTEVRASWELSDFAMRIGYDVEGSPNGDFTALSPISPLTGGFSYAQKGVSVLSAGYYGADEDSILFTQKLYGTYLIELDSLSVKPLDYVFLFEELLETVDLNASSNSGALADAVYNAIDASSALCAKIEKSGWDIDGSRDFNMQLYRISKSIQDRLISLSWEDEVVFAHERYQLNAKMLSAAVEALMGNEVENAVYGCLSAVDMNSCACLFDKETYDYFVGQVLGENSVNSWGSGYIEDNADLFDIIREIITKSESEDEVDYLTEMEALDIELIGQQMLLQDTVGQMTKDVISITKSIERLAE